MGEIVTVEELIWQLLQAAAGQVDRVDPLRRRLTAETKQSDHELATGQHQNLRCLGTLVAVRCQRRCSV